MTWLEIARDIIGLALFVIGCLALAGVLIALGIQLLWPRQIPDDDEEFFDGG